MKLYYITLENPDQARRISHILLEKKLAVCLNWFPVTSAYYWEGKLVEDAETVLIVKTDAGYREKIEQVIAQEIDYTNFIAELPVESVNQPYLEWLNTSLSPIQK